MFKSNFLLWIVVELLWFGLQLSFIGVLYLHTEKIGTWSKWEVVMSTSPSTTSTSEAPCSTVSILRGVAKLCLREGINVGPAASF